MQPRLHGSHVGIHNLCDLFKRCAFVFEQNQRFLLQWRQGCHSAGYGRSHYQLLLRIDAWRIHAGIVQLLFGPMIAILLQRQIARDGEEIGLQYASRRVEPVRGSHKSQECLLRQIFGQILATRQTVEKAIHRLVVLVECVFGRHVGSSTITANAAPGYGSEYGLRNSLWADNIGRMNLLLTRVALVLAIVWILCSALTSQQAGQPQRIAQFENDDVKVWRTTVMPNAPLAMHTHDHPRVIVALSGGTIKVINEDGTSETHQWDTGKAYWLPLSEGKKRHTDANQGSKPIEVMVVELKKAQ
jgi:hypothetical protein